MALGFLSYTDDGDVTSVSPLYETGDFLYIRADIETPKTIVKQTVYKVLRPYFPTDGLGTGNYVDSGGTATADSSGALDASTVGAGDDTSTLFPTRYKLQQVANTSIEVDVHETEVLNLAGARIVGAAAVTAWADPA